MTKVKQNISVSKFVVTDKECIKLRCRSWNIVRGNDSHHRSTPKRCSHSDRTKTIAIKPLPTHSRSVLILSRFPLFFFNWLFSNFTNGRRCTVSRNVFQAMEVSDCERLPAGGAPYGRSVERGDAKKERLNHRTPRSLTPYCLTYSDFLRSRLTHRFFFYGINIEVCGGNCYSQCLQTKKKS